MKKILLTFLLVFSFMFICGNDTAYAAEGVALNLNGIKTTGAIVEAEEEDLYVITLTQASKLEISIESHMEYYSFNLKDEWGQSIETENGLQSNNVTGLRKDNYVYHLKAGTYLLTVNGYRGWGNYYSTGDYYITAKATSANETYPEKAEDNFAAAPVLSFNNNIFGQIAENDLQDLYRFTVLKSGEVKLDVTSYMTDYSVYIYNENGAEIYHKATAYNEAIGYVNNVHELELIPGDYYIKVTGQAWRNGGDRGRGNYNFKLTFKDAKETGKEPNNDFKTATTIYSGKLNKGHLAIDDIDPQDIYKIVVDKKCRLSIDLSVYFERCGLAISNSSGVQIFKDSYFRWDSTAGYKDHNIYKDVEPGVYYITVYHGEGLGNYDLKATQLTLLEDCKVSVDKSVVCTGKEVKVPIKITYGGYTLKEGTDYTTEYNRNVNITSENYKASVKITGIGKYAGTVEKQFDIVVKVGKKAVAGDYVYKFASDSEVILCGLNNKGITTVNVSSSAYIGGKYFTVIKIDKKAFANNTKIISVSLPYTITEVRSSAFYGCKNLTKVSFNSAPTIGANAFEKCSKLTTVDGLRVGAVITLGKNIYTVTGDNVVEFAGLVNIKDTSLVVPSTVTIGAEKQKVTSIAANAVVKAKIKKATIAKTVTQIGDKAFKSCTSLTKVVFKGKNITMGTAVFDGCKNLKTIEGGKGSTFIAGNYKYEITGSSSVTLAGLKDNSVTKVSVGATVKLGAKEYKITSVKEGAFRYTNITTVSLGSNVKKIGKEAFYGCSALKKVVFKGKDISIAEYAFGYCNNLGKFEGSKGSVFVYGVNKYKVIGSKKVAFVGVTSEYGDTISIPDSITIGNTSYKVTEIAAKALRGKDILAVYIGSNVTKIGKQAFEKCSDLMEISIASKKISTIEAKAFSGVDSYVEVYIPYAKEKAYKKLLKNAGMPKKATYYY